MTTRTAGRTAWSKAVSNSEAHRRAGGRARINAHRQRLAEHRRNRVHFLYFRLGLPQYIVAALLGCSRSTICSDIKRLRFWVELGERINGQSVNMSPKM